MAAAKSVTRKGGDPVNALDTIQTPVNEQQLLAAVVQLQNTVNALIVQFNAHYHTETVDATVIWAGGEVAAHVSGLAVDVAAGEIRKSDGTFVPILASNNLALTTADATNPRIDLIQVHTTTGVVSKKNGTAAGSPVAPAVDASNIALAQVRVNATATTPTSFTDVRAFPGLDVGAVTPQQVDGAAKSAANLFTTT